MRLRRGGWWVWSRVWGRWPEFGWFLAADGKTEHWRGQREERDWPTHLQRTTPWPWTPTPTDEPGETWDGPTHCMDAIIEFITTTNTAYSLNQLHTRLRERGLSYRDKTIDDAARLAHQKGLLTQQPGPRGALQFGPPTTPTLTDETF